MESLQELAGVQYWLLATMLPGLALLTFGGDWLADGAASLAAMYRARCHRYHCSLNATSAPDFLLVIIFGGDSLYRKYGEVTCKRRSYSRPWPLVCPIAGRALLFLGDSLADIGNCCLHCVLQGGVESKEGALLIV